MFARTEVGQGIRRNAGQLLARVLTDYWRYVLTLAFYAICWPIGKIAMATDERCGCHALELLLRASEAVDEGSSR